MITRVFAISDLHLSFGCHNAKPMTRFGPLWEGHPDIIREHWERTVGKDDLVLLPGDISWANKIRDAMPDLLWLDSLPGQKLLIKGNHDYWLKDNIEHNNELPPSIHILRTSFMYGGVYVFGTRGWKSFEELESDKDKKVWERELYKLLFSFTEVSKMATSGILMLHFPPFTKNKMGTLWWDLIKERMIPSFNITDCVYGHFHQEDQLQAFEGEREGINFHFVSCDFLKFCPKLILER